MNNAFFKRSLITLSPADIKPGFHRCFYCGFTFEEGRPIFQAPADAYGHVQNFFDSPVCVKQQVMAEGSFNAQQRSEWLTRMFMEVGINPVEVPDIPKNMLEGYGGNVPHSALLDDWKNINTVRLRGPAFVQVSALVEEPFKDTTDLDQVQPAKKQTLFTPSEKKISVASLVDSLASFKASEDEVKEVDDTKNDEDESIVPMEDAPASTPDVARVVSVNTKPNKPHPLDDPLLTMLMSISSPYIK